MFYCAACREKHGYPESILKSYGPCEICGNTAVCDDVPSSVLSSMRGKKK
jgi:hypothetical protein